MEYETVIGLEVHAQLLTASKMYCRCSSDYASAPPNTHVCPVCLGMPGVLPTMNRRAIEFVMMTGLALNCIVSEHSKFDRKNYPYPDLMKGYQISQFDAPIAIRGWLNIEAEGVKKKAGITRVHLEEDVAKMIHQADVDDPHSLVDVNRAGVPLMEIVGEPDLRSPEEARQYLIKLRSILQYLGVSTGNMEEGSFRCDANISIRPVNTQEFMPKVEVKNMNSFRAVYRALEYEGKRQRILAGQGKTPVQETRGWVEEDGKTVSQRSKEHAHDYRYFPEPDLPPLFIDAAWVDRIKVMLPELPEDRRDRFMRQYGLPIYDANLLTESKPTADYYESCLKPGDTSLQAKAVSNWILGEFNRLLNATNTDIKDSRVTALELCHLIELVQKGNISGTSAKAVFEEMFKTGYTADEIIKNQGLNQITDMHEIETAIEGIIAANPQPVADFKAGKTQAIKFLIGQVMKATRGRANANMAQELLLKKIEGN